MESVYQSGPYKRSRSAYCVENMFEYFVNIMTTGAFLATLLKNIGVSDALTGVISSMASLAFLFQVASVPVVRKVKNTKRFCAIFHNSSQICKMLLYLIPFTNLPIGMKTTLFVVGSLLSYFGMNFVSTNLYRWGNSFVAPDHRARYNGNREMVSLAGGVAVQIGAGYIMDRFIEAGKTRQGFLFAAAMVFLFALGDFICLMFFKNEIANEAKASTPFKEVLKHTFGNRTFLFFTLLHSLFYMGIFAVQGFMGTYQIADLGMSLTMVEILVVGGCGLRFLLTPFIAKYADRSSYAHGIRLGLLLEAVGLAALVFATPEYWWFVAVYQAFKNVGEAGVAANLVNVLFGAVGEQYFSEASAIKSSIAGLSGFLISLLSAKILSAIQANGNTVFGVPIYGQQLFAAFGAICLLAAALLITVWFHKNKSQQMKNQ